MPRTQVPGPKPVERAGQGASTLRVLVVAAAQLAAGSVGL